MNENKQKVKAVGLMSGGLDSTLAARLVKECDVEVYGLFCSMPWGCGNEGKARASAREVGIPLEITHPDEEFMRMLKNPRYGYGSALNPCVDCHTYMIRKAELFRQKIDAHFVFTGEVLGQRPMSQTRNSLQKVDKHCGIPGYLLRPLCALNLEPTRPEQDGLIDRDKLLDITGRSRRRQYALAEKWGLKAFMQPAGGCLLTDQNFANRMRDLFEYGYRHLNDTICLQWGRHFRLRPSFKAITGRDEPENLNLQEYADPDDIIMLFENDQPGPLVILQGARPPQDILDLAGGLIQIFSKFKSDPPLPVLYWTKNNALNKTVFTPPKLTEKKALTFKI
ncbi:MAG: tRNA 4-thiouridine(8) synthase ThiI [Candidatus Omnitrophica bacterium]|nr:tRNA 4-thiouridine(8) synthase ThiI [Candidatus Omnitrophota bacterium]